MAIASLLIVDDEPDIAWDDEHADPASVKTYVHLLRRKLGWDSGDDGPLETVRGVGYRYRAA